MLTQENKDQIIKITKEYFANFPELTIDDLGVKVEKIYKELPNLYKKLEEAKVLPDGMNLNVFMHVVLPRLQEEAQRAYAQSMFGIAI